MTSKGNEGKQPLPGVIPKIKVDILTNPLIKALLWNHWLNHVPIRRPAMEKKLALIKAAANLFADQGFDGTTTFQIAKEACVTEPLIYYHFEGKDELFTHILESTFENYFSRLKSLKNDTPTEFQKIEDLITLHLTIVDEMPTEIRLIVSTCPAKLKDPKNICMKNIKKHRDWHISFLTRCIENGIKKGEFRKVPVKKTVFLVMALINGLVRQKAWKFSDVPDLKGAAIDFCRTGLLL
jgi:AcrR family transcriptional regulator